MGSQVARVAHQKQRREVAEDESQPCQSAADTDVLLHLAVTTAAKGGQVAQLIGVGGGRKRTKRNFVMHVMLSRPERSAVLSLSKGRRVGFGDAADLTAIPVPRAHKVADAPPIGAVLVRVV